MYGKEIMLCQKPAGCCPILKKKGRKYSISDKGQEVLLTKEESKTLCRELCKLNCKNTCNCGCD